MGDDMASIFQQVKISGFATLLRAVAPERVEKFQAAFQQNRHRIYALAFWMTDNETGSFCKQGSVPCIVKPFQVADLIAATRALLSRSEKAVAN